MSSREWQGYWWLPGKPDARQAGILTVDDEGKSRLQLIGGFDLTIRHDLKDGGVGISGQTKEPPVILGESEGRMLTLLHSIVTRQHGSLGMLLGAPASQDLHVHRVLAGIHLQDVDAAEFRSANVRIENLTSWLQVPAAERSFTRDGSEYRATLIKVPTVSAEVDGWRFEAGADLRGFNEERTRASIILTGDATASLHITPPEPMALKAFDRVIHEFTDLVTLASGKAAGLISMSLQHTTDHVIEMHEDTELRRPVEVQVFGERIYVAEPQAPALEPHRFNFTSARTYHSKRS